VAILKIKNPGDEATLGIAELEIVPSTDPKMGNQVKFTTLTGDTLYVGESSVLRQLDRCGVAEIADLAGKTIHFSRAANKNPAFPPYWDLDKARPEDVATPKPNGKPVTTSKRAEGITAGTLPGDEAALPILLAEGDADPWAVIVKKQRQCIAEAKHDLLALKAAGLSAEEIRAIFAQASTLLIERSKKGA
jgi:hypothetical protein